MNRVKMNLKRSKKKVISNKSINIMDGYMC